MDCRIIAIILICIAAITVAGCTTQPAAPAGTGTIPSSPAIQPVASSPSPAPAAECTRAADCVPAECCHPADCVPASQAPVCGDIMCTAVCMGPLDCGAGSCGCAGGKCIIVPAAETTRESAEGTAIALRASPERYSPILSSTPGVGIEPVMSGSGTANATFTWSATYGQFLSWNPPDFRVHELGSTAKNHGEKLYWSFTDPAPSTAVPVTITVTVTDTAKGRILGSGTLVLDWESTTWVRVRT